MKNSHISLSRFTLFLFIIVSSISNNIHAAETQELAVENSQMTAEFPCTPKKKRQVVAKTELGDIITTSLTCSKSDSAYHLSITQYPKEYYKMLSEAEWLDSTLDDARSKKYIKIKSSKVGSHQKYSAIRSNILDTRKPNTTSVSLAVITDDGMILIMATTPPALEKSKTVSAFLNSLSIK